MGSVYLHLHGVAFFFLFYSFLIVCASLACTEKFLSTRLPLCSSIEHMALRGREGDRQRGAEKESIACIDPFRAPVRLYSLWSRSKPVDE